MPPMFLGGVMIKLDAKKAANVAGHFLKDFH